MKTKKIIYFIFILMCIFFLNSNSANNSTDQINKEDDNLNNLKYFKRMEIDGKVYIYLKSVSEDDIILKISNEGSEEIGGLEFYQIDPEIISGELLDDRITSGKEQLATLDKGDSEGNESRDKTRDGSLLEPSNFNVISKHYIVESEVSENNALEINGKLEALFELYNNYFRFNDDDFNQSNKMRVKIFKDEFRLSNYLKLITNKDYKNNFIYLHYPYISKSLLVGYYNEDNITFSHQANIQFFRRFIKNPPFWLRTGMAIFFERVAFEKKEDGYRAYLDENLNWLSYLKEKINKDEILTIKELLEITKNSTEINLDVFYPQSWGFVSFLIYSKDKYKRTLWDTFKVLKSRVGEDQNIRILNEDIFKWINNFEIFDRDFKEYILSDLLTYNDLINKNDLLYKEDKLNEAENYFKTSLDQNKNKDDYIPYYYLGMLNYEKRAYLKAENYLLKALNIKEGDKDNIYYALSLNSFEKGDNKKAANYLKGIDKNKLANKDLKNYEYIKKTLA